jgi:UDP-glucuronate 4-epimerase
MQAGDVKKTWANVDNLSADFNYMPGHSIESGIKLFIKWYNRFYGNIHG